MATAALQAVAATPPTDYLNLYGGREGGLRQSNLQYLYDQCAQAGLMPSAAADDIARLHAIFDVALEHGLGSLVQDYIHEVCWDRHLTSSDPVEAFLLDSECVRRWCHKTLTVSRGRLTSWLSGGLTTLAQANSNIQKELGKLRILETVAKSLAQAEDNNNNSSTEGHEAMALVQCAEVAAWLSSEKLANYRPSGRYASEQEWRSIFSKRRDNAAPDTLFITDILASLADFGVDNVQYPPSSLERLLPMLFLSGSTSLPAWHMKLAVLTYCIVDGGFLHAEAAVTGLVKSFHIPPSQAYSWLLLLFCDDTYSMPKGSQARSQSLKQAADFVPAVNGAVLPFKVLRTFLIQGTPEAALDLLRQRNDFTQASEEEASLALDVMLVNGNLAEGFLEMKRYIQGSSDEERHQRARRLVTELMQWAGAVATLHAVIRLPLAPGDEEDAALAWLQTSGGVAAGSLTALYFLMRGRTPEAISVFDKYCKGKRGSTEVEEVLKTEVGSLLVCSAESITALQRDALDSQNSPRSGIADSILLGSIPNIVGR